MQSILDKLKENLQVIYRRALDADKALAKLQQGGKGKFQQVFAEDAPFTVQSKRFAPYVEELARDILALEQEQDESRQQTMLQPVVRKMELLFVTLANLQQSLKD